MSAENCQGRQRHELELESRGRNQGGGHHTLGFTFCSTHIPMLEHADVDRQVCMTQCPMLSQGLQPGACSKAIHEGTGTLQAKADQIPELTSCTMFSYTSLNLRPQIVWNRPVPLLEPGKWLFFSIC